ncbi:MAG: type VI secretion lipoprotein TssJ [Deltaproteobacteria bacterium]|jgi:predicted component of type VI protein secretion system|nr:type VI secretion lipoprotein TssJ [Deltaproteobacteria bacterium]
MFFHACKVRLKTAGWVVLAALALWSAGCGGKSDSPTTPPPSPPVKSPDQLGWSYSPRGIRIGLIADVDLNWTENVPAALSLCLYQLSDLTWFSGNMSSSQGLRDLADCQAAPAAGAAPSAPPAGLVSATRLLIQPGQVQDLVFDRLNGTKFVAVAGGYSTLPAQGGAAYISVPIHENKKWFFANTFEIEELIAWLLLKKQSLAFFYKTEKDANRSAGEFATKPAPSADSSQAAKPSAPDPAASPASQAAQPSAPGQVTPANPAKQSSSTFRLPSTSPVNPQLIQPSPNAQSAPAGPQPAGLPSPTGL